MLQTNRRKESIAWIGLMISLLSCPIVNAAGAAQTQDSIAESYLQQIASYTNQILTNSNQMLAKITDLTKLLGQYLNSWLTPTSSDSTTPTLQADMATIGTQFSTDLAKQMTMLPQLNKSLLMVPATTPQNPAQPISSAVLPNANDLLYSVLLDASTAYFNPDPRGKGVNSQYNYILNASGIGLVHFPPNPNANGKPIAINSYSSYYNAIMAAQSYSAYVLSNQYVDGNQLNTQQTALLGLASTSNWFALVQSENLGSVLRHMLMFESQIYVMLTQMVQLQKQMLTAQVIGNTLQIATTYNNESQMYLNAQGAL